MNGRWARLTPNRASHETDGRSMGEPHPRRLPVTVKTERQQADIHWHGGFLLLVSSRFRCGEPIRLASVGNGKCWER